MIVPTAPEFRRSLGVGSWSLLCAVPVQTFIDGQPLFMRWLRWTCEEECRHGCMWDTVKAFQKDRTPVPQFHGKVPTAARRPSYSYVEILEKSFFAASKISPPPTFSQLELLARKTWTTYNRRTVLESQRWVRVYVGVTIATAILRPPPQCHWLVLWLDVKVRVRVRSE